MLDSELKVSKWDTAASAWALALGVIAFREAIVVLWVGI